MSNSVSKNVILTGVGGQGTVLASRLISTAAMRAGLPVKAAETIGMAQRGGSVCSYVRVGGDAATPFVGRGGADLIIGFEPAEAVRMLPYLKPGGAVVANDRPIVPVSAMTGGPAYDLEGILTALRGRVDDERLVLVDGEHAALDLGSSKVLNVVLLGAAARTGALGFSPDDVEAAVRALVPAKFLDLNLRALAYAQ